MTREEAIKTLKENCCAMCAYWSTKDMDSCDIRSCDNKDAINALEQEPCEDAISRQDAIRIAEQGQIQGYEWQFKELNKLPPVTCQVCKKDWTKCGKCPVNMEWIREQKARWKNDMEMFTIFGLALFLFGVMVGVSLLLNIAFNMRDDEMLCGLGFIVVMLVLSFAISSFFIQPENFGYEKIVSNNSVEQEVEKL